MKIFLIIILLYSTNRIYAQKPLLDGSVYANWETLDNPKLNSNGKYVIYGTKRGMNSFSTILYSTDGKWKKEFKGNLNSPEMTDNGKYLLFVKGKDSLVMLTLGTDEVKYIANISTYQLRGENDAQILCYHPSNKKTTLILRNLKTKAEQRYNDVIHEDFSEDAKALLLFQSTSEDPTKQTISLVDLGKQKLNKLWEGSEIQNLVLNSKTKQLVFTIGDSLFYYKPGTDKATCLIKSISKKIESGFSFSRINNFSKDGKRLFISLEKTDESRPKQDAVQIWSYRDEKLQSEQEGTSWMKTFSATLNIETFKTLRLQEQVTDRIFLPDFTASSDSIALINRDDNYDERWNISRETVWYLISTVTGKRTKLDFLNGIRNTVSMSSSGKYLIYFNFKEQDFLSYEIKTGIIRNLTKDVDVSWKDLRRDDAYPTDSSIFPRAIGNIKWLINDEAALVYDRYDIWRLDPSNKIIPINLTNGYGKKHKIIFNYTFDSSFKDQANNLKTIYLDAFDTETKENGFFEKDINKIGDPTYLSMGPYIYCTNTGYVPNGSDFVPIKAKKGNEFIVRRMSASEAPNYFSTKNFKTFIRVSDSHPQKQYNWYTTELHSWSSLDGRVLKGILYKPENFDPNKKYPVIFHYYERKSDGLNSFITPEPLCSACNIDIPTYVSQGYLVFTPDIYYKFGMPMQGTYDAVISAAKYVSKFSFVNGNKMGIQGCSYGGIQTNYLVAHTDLFAAAASAASVADYISAYGSFNQEGTTQQDFYENGSPRMGGTPWERPESYINSSAIFRIDKISTPLLLMQAKKDPICPFSNVLEFFTGLRRLGKRAWLLAYLDGNHGVYRKDADDFSLRMMQFFDHYLKDKPAPIWMTRGVFASRKGIDTGLEYDKEIVTPGPGLLKHAEQQIVDSLMKVKTTTITLK